jgi:hypothetical protein
MISPRSTIFTPDQGMDWTRSSEWAILVSDLALAKPPFAPLGITRETSLKYLRQYVAGLAHVNVGRYLLFSTRPKHNPKQSRHFTIATTSFEISPSSRFTAAQRNPWEPSGLAT